ncbi:OsmC family protein [Piscinibacter sp. HJYY11]|uniref:OsmC family protein n=1 Tax=Piscinibacter sp. HJYY11 TaxID=2801333 RepID=UPI00191E8ED9|nr:OsmC family protein [Piscinibacter sp. HJYY11]MBL0729916.1 OsmC family protein [Piscinibacter sp. HJYY11]
MSHQQIREALAGVTRHFEQHPELGPTTDSTAVATWQGGLRFQTAGPNGATLVSEMPKAVGGGGSAPTPGWLLRAALANCNASMIALRAAQSGIALTRLDVSVDSDSNDRGMLGLSHEVPPGPLAVRVKVRLAADGASAAQLQELVTWAERHSPVADALQRAVPVSTSVEIG